MTSSTRFPQGFDIYKEPYDGYTHRPHFLKQEEISQYAVKNSCPDITWNLYGFPMPKIKFLFEGKDIELGEKYTCTYSRNGIVKVYDFPDLNLIDFWYLIIIVVAIQIPYTAVSLSNSFKLTASQRSMLVLLSVSQPMIMVRWPNQ